MYHLTSTSGVSVIPSVSKIQYQQSGGTFVDITGTLYVLKGTPVTFKAIPNPPSASWPSGKPIWGGTSGASGTGATTSKTFNTVSSSTSDFKTVTATSGNILTVNVIVFDLTGVLTPQDNFTGRSFTRFGIQEHVSLSFTVTPTGITASQAGGLQWELTGSGTLNAPTADGTGTYDAPQTEAAVTLRLKVQGGPSQGNGPSSNISIIAPSAGYETKEIGTNLAHFQYYWSCGFRGTIYITPKDVSFANVGFIEDEIGAQASGWLSFLASVGHSPNTTPNPIGFGNIDSGGAVFYPDNVYPGAYGGPGTTYAPGDVSWTIPWRYVTASGTRVLMGSVTEHGTSISSGRATISKGGAGPFSKEVNDFTSDY